MSLYSDRSLLVACTLTGCGYDPVMDASVLTITQGEYLWFEGEEGDLSAPMQVGWNGEASSGEYVWVPRGGGIEGEVEYSFEVIEEGDYVVWGRVIANDSTEDSFFVSMDGGADVLWGTLRGGVETWVWDQVSERFGADPVAYHLTEGLHTLVVKRREYGTKLDRILITNDRGYVPEGLGEEISHFIR